MHTAVYQVAEASLPVWFLDKQDIINELNYLLHHPELVKNMSISLWHSAH